MRSGEKGDGGGVRGRSGLGKAFNLLVLGLITAIASPFLLLLYLWILPDWLRERRFRIHHDRRWFLVATRRHGWYEFVRDGVAPALPDGTGVAWFERPGRREQKELVLRACYGTILEQEKPFLLQVGRRVKDCRVVPLHDRLKASLDGGDWKRPEVRAVVRREIEEALVEAGGA